MCSLNDFVQSLACRVGRNANLGSDRGRQQIMAGAHSLRGDKCIMQLQWNKPVSLHRLLLHCAARREADRSLYQPLPSAIKAAPTLPSQHLATCVFPHCKYYRKCSIFNLRFRVIFARIYFTFLENIQYFDISQMENGFAF